MPGPSVAHSLSLPLGPALLNLWTNYVRVPLTKEKTTLIDMVGTSLNDWHNNPVETIVTVESTLNTGFAGVFYLWISLITVIELIEFN